MGSEEDTAGQQNRNGDGKIEERSNPDRAMDARPETERMRSTQVLRAPKSDETPTKDKQSHAQGVKQGRNASPDKGKDQARREIRQAHSQGPKQEQGATLDHPAESLKSIGYERAAKDGEIVAVQSLKPKDREILRDLNEQLLRDDEVSSTLVAASEVLAAAREREKVKQKGQKSAWARFLASLSPKRFLTRCRDCYVDTCVMASERGDFTNLMVGHPGVFYAPDNIMSRNSSQKRERDEEELIASLSRQVSASSQAANRGASPSLNRTKSTGIAGLKRNSSTGVPGLSRNASAGIAGLNRSGSTGMPSLSRQSSAGMNGALKRSSSHCRSDAELFAHDRNAFRESLAAKNAGLIGNPPMKKAH